MSRVLRALAVPLVIALGLTACSGDGAMPFTTGSSTSAIAPPEAPKIDPACVALNARIDGLRRDGVTEKAAQTAAAGKSATVSIKREQLARLAELDRANAEFQVKCGTLGPRPAITPAAGPPAAAAASASPYRLPSSSVRAARQAPADSERSGLEASGN